MSNDTRNRRHYYPSGCTLTEEQRERTSELRWRRFGFLSATIMLPIIGSLSTYYYSTGVDPSGFSAAGAAVCFAGSILTGFLVHTTNCRICQTLGQPMQPLCSCSPNSSRDIARDTRRHAEKADPEDATAVPKSPRRQATGETPSKPHP